MTVIRRLTKGVATDEYGGVTREGDCADYIDST